MEKIGQCCLRIKKTDDKTVHDFKNTSIGSVFLFFLLHGFFPGLDELILKNNLQNAKLCLMHKPFITILLAVNHIFFKN